MAILFLHLNKQQSITQQRLQLHNICTEQPAESSPPFQQRKHVVWIAMRGAVEAY